MTDRKRPLLFLIKVLPAPAIIPVACRQTPALRRKGNNMRKTGEPSLSCPVGRASGVSPRFVSEPAAGFRGLRKIHKKVPPALHGEAPCFLPGRESSFPVLFPEPDTLPGGGGRGRLPSSCAVFSRILGKAQKKGGRQKTCLPGLFFVRRFIRPWPWGLLPADLPERFSYVSRGACHSFSFCVRG